MLLLSNLHVMLLKTVYCLHMWVLWVWYGFSYKSHWFFKGQEERLVGVTVGVYDKTKESYI